jgi:hypothetical protein
VAAVTGPDDARSELAAALAEHRAAVREFSDRATRVAPGLWTRPPAPEKWSPAEVAEHLRLALEALGRQLSGGAAMRPMVPGWTRWLLRWQVLPRILGGGWFPGGARAPREARPRDPDADPAVAMRRLSEELARFETACRAADPKTRVTHPYFGPVPLRELNRLLAAHARHHAGQLPAVAEEK